MNRTDTATKILSGYHLFSAINDDVNFIPHSHRFYEIAITLENNFQHTINGKTHRPEKGEAVILRPDDIHSALPDEGMPHKLRDIYIPCELFEEICGTLSPSFLEEIIKKDRVNPPVFYLTENELRSLSSRLETPFFINDDSQNLSFSYPGVIKKAIISELLGIYCSNQLKKANYMPECIIKLLNAFQSPKFRELPISEMAYELGYSHNYLCARFKACFGKTIQEFLIERKTEKAAALLKDTDLSVDAISKELGWSKTSCFIRNFSRSYGLTPLQYRKKYK